jgi:hypothetical protein
MARRMKPKGRDALQLVVRAVLDLLQSHVFHLAVLDQFGAGVPGILMHQPGVGFAGFGYFDGCLSLFGQLILRQDKMRRGKNDQARRQNGQDFHAFFLSVMFNPN